MSTPSCQHSAVIFADANLVKRPHNHMCKGFFLFVCFFLFLFFVFLLFFFLFVLFLFLFCFVFWVFFLFCLFCFVFVGVIRQFLLQKQCCLGQLSDAVQLERVQSVSGMHYKLTADIALYFDGPLTILGLICCIFIKTESYFFVYCRLVSISTDFRLVRWIRL